MLVDSNLTTSFFTKKGFVVDQRVNMSYLRISKGSDGLVDKCVFFLGLLSNSGFTAHYTWLQSKVLQCVKNISVSSLNVQSVSK